MTKHAGKGPTEGLFGFDLEPQFPAPDAYWTAAAKFQAEWLQLYFRRLGAYCEIPETLSRCQGPTDLARAQQDFFATMQRDYADAARRVFQPETYEPMIPEETEAAAAQPQPREEPATAETTPEPAAPEITKRAA